MNVIIGEGRVIRMDLWTPITISKGLGPKPLPMFVMFAWHALNADAIEKSRRCTDPFPAEPADPNPATT